VHNGCDAFSALPKNIPLSLRHWQVPDWLKKAMFNALATCSNKALPVQEPGHVYILGTIPAIVASVHQGNRIQIFKRLVQRNCTAEF